MDIEYLLTATRSARKTLDLDAPVDSAEIRECLRIGLQAANGSNQRPAPAGGDRTDRQYAGRSFRPV
jgi:hypothetical protein